MREVFHPATEQLNLATILNAFGDPVRLGLLKMIAEQKEITCSGCSTCSDMKKSALSHHFRILRESGVIRVRLEGKNRYLSLRTEDLESRFPGLLDSILKSL